MSILNRKSYNNERNNLSVNSLFLECWIVFFLITRFNHSFFLHRVFFHVCFGWFKFCFFESSTFEQFSYKFSDKVKFELLAHRALFIKSSIVTIFMTRLHWNFQKVFIKSRSKNGSVEIFSKFKFPAYFFPPKCPKSGYRYSDICY